MEQIFTYACVAFITVLLALTILWSNGVFNTYLSKSARRAGAKWKVGNILFIGSFLIGYGMSDAAMWFVPSTGYIIAMGVLLALGVCVNCGFNFTIEE
jgi:p-aminobenzoyl-glutamate transporter AbgT